MLSKFNRISKKKEIDLIFKEGSWTKDQYLSLVTARNKLGGVRFVIVAGLKVSKKATVRNKIKRRIRHSIGLGLGEIKPGHDVAVLATKNIAADKSFQEINLAIRKLFEKAGLLK